MLIEAPLLEAGIQLLGPYLLDYTANGHITTAMGNRHPLAAPPKEWGDRGGARYWLGGLVFGLGWGLLGACPGPLYALIGGGAWPLTLALASALLGAVAYDRLRSRLPH